MPKHSIFRILSTLLCSLLLTAALGAQEYSYAGKPISSPKKESSFKHSFEFSPTFMRASDGNDWDLDMGGINMSFGYRFNTYNKVQFDFGLLYGSEEATFVQVTEHANHFAAPFLVTYRLCIPLGKAAEWELYLAPSVGATLFSVKMDFNYTNSESQTDNDQDILLTYGVGVGVSYHYSNDVYFSLGYRYMNIAEGSYQLYSRTAKIGDLDTHSIMATLGWKF